MKKPKLRKVICQGLKVRAADRMWVCLNAGSTRGVQPFGISGGSRVVLGHTLNTQTLIKTDERKNKVLSKFTILCWATFIAILGCMRPVGHGLDTPGHG